MPKRTYTPLDKQTVRRLLILHGGDVGIVHGLTDIPKRTIYDWRIAWGDDYDGYFDAFAQKILARADAVERAKKPVNPTITADPDTAQPGESFAQFTQLREMLMAHVMTLTQNLTPGDPNISQHVLAISRLTDRILQLDEILPDKNPEKVVRFEFVSDGKVTLAPPWETLSEYEESHDDFP